MWVVTYKVTKEDFFTGAVEEIEHHIFSKVEVKPGKVDVEKGHNQDYSKFWIEKINVAKAKKASKKEVK
jgi:hypothetical protein